MSILHLSVCLPIYRFLNDVCGMNKLVQKNRLSNIEALRILAMFLVLVVHADFFTFGHPTIDLYAENPTFVLGQYFFESLSIGCVNIFILISGWFGIHSSKKGFFKLVFQCLFFLVGIYIFCLLIGIADYSLTGFLKGIAGCLVLLQWNWFIKAYICLYIMAPILNAYVEKASKRNFMYMLLAFFFFQTMYAWITSAASFFHEGYSTISFMGLYLLARYVRLYPNKLTTLSYKTDLLIFFVCVLLITGISYASLNAAIHFHPQFIYFEKKMFSYVNPIVILMSLYILLFFSKIPFSNKTINWLGASSFGVFLLHTNPNLCKPYFCGHILYLGDQFNGIMFFVVVLAYLVLVFILAVLIDQIRLFLWRRISKMD